MSKYVKKPIPIEAIQWHGGNEDEIRAFAGKSVKFVRHFSTTEKMPWISTSWADLYIESLEGRMKADVGDYVVKGIKGEFYICAKDIFEESYEEVK